MTHPPEYFVRVRERAEKRWMQLEGDPELAGPWHQLFKQVQSPRHVLSELLQNADDAGATEAFVHCADGCFLFSHNGEDFTEEHFASLCRFGYSNKRSLHTIGFRGIGFKSVFSLGDIVELHTPSLSVSFHRKRFTEPKWIGNSLETNGLTQIRVASVEDLRHREIEKNLQEWMSSPVSLLFFKNIRCLTIGEREVRWESHGPGPVPETEWMALKENPHNRFLIARSMSEAFPDETMEEIRQERLIDANEEMEFPPCKVEIVLYAKGRFYVVLPTGIETKLPFACNAPFIQDPARLKIKDPNLSPTNRWLLERVGKLAASVMLQWLQNEGMSVEDRSGAYELFSDIDRNVNSLEGNCAVIVEKAFDHAIHGNPFLLTHAGKLELTNGSIIIPAEISHVWPPENAGVYLDKAKRPPLSFHISNADQRKLVHRGVTEFIDKNRVFEVLREEHLPKPETWRQLLKLWSYLASEFTGYSDIRQHDSIRIVPVQGKNVLYAASEVVRLAEKRLLQSDTDWEFLSTHLLVLNQNWPRFLGDQRRQVEDHEDGALRKDIEKAFSVLTKIGLENPSDVSKVIERVGQEFFSREKKTIAECVQLAQIAAKLGASLGNTFRFVTQDNCLRNIEIQDNYLRKIENDILFDANGSMEDLFDPRWYSEHVLHADYSKTYASCTSEEWASWVSSGRAKILKFVQPKSKRKYINGRQEIEKALQDRGITSDPIYPYVRFLFYLDDWDFEDIHWNRWTVVSKDDPGVWCRIVECILNQPEHYWSKCKNAKAIQVAGNGNERVITRDPLLPAWILKFREKACLRDTKGFYRKPTELLRRTVETESLIDVEPFIRGEFDNEATRPLLVLLGVRDVPTGPDRLLDCLRALSKSEIPPLQEIDKWYRRLDQMIDSCSTTAFTKIKDAFHNEKIILSESGEWTNAPGAFLSADEEDVPGVAVIRAGVRDLMLWRKIGIAETPTAELAILWLKKLSPGERLAQSDAKRVRALLARYPNRIWEECKHWLNLTGEWVSIDALSYALSMQSLVTYTHLHEWVKQKTADLLRLPAEVANAFPFSGLTALAGCIEDRFNRETIHKITRVERCPWIYQFGMELQRVALEDKSETLRIRALATELMNSMWQRAHELEIIPYIDGTPAGMPRRADAVWICRVLYVEDRPLAKLARAVSQEIGRVFRRQDIVDAIKHCFDRTPEYVTEYMEENFDLVPMETLEPEPDRKEGAPERGNPPVDDLSNTLSNGKEPVSDNTVGTQGEGSDVGERIGNAGNDLERVEGGDDKVEDEISLRREPPPHKPAKLSVMERFAFKQGFQRDGDGRFFHPNGSWIGKAREEAFPWERRMSGGGLVCYYLPKDHCLEREPLQLEADKWGLIEKFPDKYTLILSDPNDEPVEVPGSQLRALREAGSLILYPASYRLVLDYERKE